MSKVTKENVDDAMKGGNVPPEIVGEQYELLTELKGILAEDLEMAEDLAKQIDAETDAVKLKELKFRYLKLAEQIKLAMYSHDKFSRKLMKQIENELVIRKPNPKKANPETARRNQEISDRCCEAGYHTQDKPRKGTWKQVFQEIAKDYPNISWYRVQKIAKDKTIIPTQLQTSK